MQNKLSIDKVVNLAKTDPAQNVSSNEQSTESMSMETTSMESILNEIDSNESKSLYLDQSLRSTLFKKYLLSEYYLKSRAITAFIRQISKELVDYLEFLVLSETSVKDILNDDELNLFFSSLERKKVPKRKFEYFFILEVEDLLKNDVFDSQRVKRIKSSILLNIYAQYKKSLNNYSNRCTSNKIKLNTSDSNTIFYKGTSQELNKINKYNNNAPKSFLIHRKNLVYPRSFKRLVTDLDNDRFLHSSDAKKLIFELIK